MASNKSGINNPKAKGGKDLGGTMLKMIAYGVAGGALLISWAKRFGEVLLEKQENDQKTLDAQRESDREDVRRITANDPNEQ